MITGWRKLILVFAGAAGILAIILLTSPVDRWMCLTQLDRYTPHSTLWVRVPDNKRSDLFRYLEEFSERNSLLFAINSFPAGEGSLTHDTYSAQLCNRLIDIEVRNTHAPNLFSLHVAYYQGRGSEQLSGLIRSFVQNLTASFERATESEVKAVH
jgi:hypothetical protein